MELLIERARVADFFGTFYEQGYVLVSGGRIEAVGEGTPPEVPGARRLDAAGRLLTPCLLYTSPSPRD